MSDNTLFMPSLEIFSIIISQKGVDYILVANIVISRQQAKTSGKQFGIWQPPLAKKSAPQGTRRISLCDNRLSFRNSTGGAVFCASTATNANIGIDYEDITFRDSINGATCFASATCYTIFVNYVSHF